MANDINFNFKIRKEFELINLQHILKIITKRSFDEKNLQFKKSIKNYYLYEYYDKKEEICTSFYWYPSENKLLISMPIFPITTSYCKKIIKEIYQILKIGGYGFDDYSTTDHEAGLPKKEKNQLIIWSVNLFTPEEVKKYGRKKLLKAPCEHIEEWEDGAIFMMIHKDKFNAYYEERQKLRKYLKNE